MLCQYAFPFFSLSSCSASTDNDQPRCAVDFHERVCEVLCHLPAVSSSCWNPAVKTAQTSVEEEEQNEEEEESRGQTEGVKEMG